MKAALILSAVAIFSATRPGSCGPVPLENGTIATGSYLSARGAGPVALPGNEAKSDSGTSISRVIMLKYSENRPWETILSNMGLGSEIKEIKTANRSSSLEESAFGTLRYFKTSGGRNIRTSGGQGGTMRVLATNLTESEVNRVRSFEYVELVEDDKMSRMIDPLPPAQPGAKRPPKMARPQQDGTHDSSLPRCGARGFDGKDLPVISQCGAPWGLERISSRESSMNLDGNDVTSLAYKYIFNEGAGLGVDVYVMDTEIEVEHAEFEGRAQTLWRANQFTGKGKASGHGTHVAGIIASKTYGIAKAARIYGIAVLVEHSGGTIDYIEATNIIILHHRSRRSLRGFSGSIVNISLGAPGAEYWDSIMRLLTDEGIHVSVSAGNNDGNSCEQSPARSSAVVPIITVGNLSFDGYRALNSNWGPCVSIFAPGSEVVSLGVTKESAPLIMGGTSMAAPHVAGVMATELSLHPAFKFNPQALKNHIIGMGLKGIIKLQRQGERERGVAEAVVLNNGFPGRR
ncbi:hypothetical protein TWF718_005113 [Orbilia javanica]|uniref:Peptidase S8/S53 domain-containing protein n=1 Tax=Orbilia javanica TaxID=47235 RepID=A0AAN8N9B7_9PEZI